MKVTIGIPFFNNRSTLGDAIRSVFAQTFTDWELILMDDGSTDGSLELARSVKDSRVRVITDGQNKKLPTRLNDITRSARGALLARMDADDLMHPERIEKQVRFLDENPAIDLVETAMASLDREDRPTGVRGTGAFLQSPLPALRRSLLMHATVMGRTEWFRRNPYSTAFPRSEDRELWARTMFHSRFARIPEPLYFVREGDTGSPEKYVRACRTNQRIALRYGPSAVGWPTTAALWLESFAKGEIYRTAYMLRLDERLVRRRNHQMSAHESEPIVARIRQIKATRLPGLEHATA